MHVQAVMLSLTFILSFAVAQSLTDPNCIGCFDTKTGMCQLDTNLTTCTLDPNNCPKGTTFVNNSMDAWPGGCLALLDAAGSNCMPLLFKHECNGGAEIADNLTHCKELANEQGADYIGWNGDPKSGENWPLPPGERALSCLISNGRAFEAGCAGCEGCQYSTYFQLSSGESKHSCAYPISTWACSKDAGGNPLCTPDTKSTMNVSACKASCGMLRAHRVST
jgi:hypothetical protein